jgi:hypothetical protein
MAATLAVISRINPGRTVDAIAAASSAAKLIERHGGHNTRLLATALAGEQVSTLVFTTELASLSDFGAFSDEANADNEVQALVEHLNSPGSPITMLSQSVGIDVPLNRTQKTGRGSVVEVFLIRVKTGGLSAYLESTARYCDLVEQHGAVATRAITLVHAGSQSGLYASVAEYPDNKTWGRAAEALYTSPAGQQLSADLDAGTLPIEVVSSALYTEVPI